MCAPASQQSRKWMLGGFWKATVVLKRLQTFTSLLCWTKCNCLSASRNGLLFLEANRIPVPSIGPILLAFEGTPLFFVVVVVFKGKPKAPCPWQEWARPSSATLATHSGRICCRGSHRSAESESLKRRGNKPKAAHWCVFSQPQSGFRLSFWSFFRSNHQKKGLHKPPHGIRPNDS